ncbi:hypothetical protein VCHA53O466_140127 [Vibrio chagasii]|nr:hypothetical protein VCHA53O466_140127 [Vibrio chagasii]
MKAINQIVPLICELKSQMDNREHEDYLSTTKAKLSLFRSELEKPLGFVVLDIDLPTNDEDSSWNCIWIADSPESDDDTKVVFDTGMGEELFYKLLRHLILEIINETGGQRRALYINYAYSAIRLKGLIRYETD